MVDIEIPDNWKLDSGLRDEVPRFTIASAYFSQTANYQDGIPFRLHLIGFDTETEPFTVKMTVGSDWVSSDGGRTITHPTRKRINNSSTYGHWINYSMQLPELRDELIRRDKEQFNGQGPLVADIWTNLVLRLNAEEFQFGKPGKDNPPRAYLMPVEFFGVDTGQSGGQSASMVASPNVGVQQPQVAQVASMPTPTPAERIAAARAAAQGNQAAMSPVMAQLHELAKASPTHDDFMTKAWDVDGVLADDELARLVATADAIYNKVRS